MQSYEKQIWHCRFLSEFVRICQFLSVFGTMLFLAAKLQKRKFGTVGICRFLSEFVGFRNDAFSRCKDTKRKFGTHLLSLFVTFCHLSVRCFFTMQSYEKKSWHCPHLSAYVRKCPHLSVFDIAMSRIVVAKLRKNILALSP